VGQRVNLRVVVEVREYLEKLVLGYGIKDRLGQVIYGTNTSFKKQILNDLQGGQAVVFNCWFDANIGPGSYSVQTALVSGDTHLENNYEWRDLALLFNVVNSSQVAFTGVAWIEPEIGIELL
jgi:lipopolysaccharide transport system ATP-binding protein